MSKTFKNREMEAGRDAFVPYCKMSKKAKRQIAAARRGDWGMLNPATRVVENKKAYNRKRVRDDYDD